MPPVTAPLLGVAGEAMAALPALGVAGDAGPAGI